MILDVNNISNLEVAVFDDFFSLRLFLSFPAKLKSPAIKQVPTGHS